MPPIRTLFFVDDHPIYRDGLCKSLASAMQDFQVFAVDGCAAARDWLAKSPPPDLCLADFRLKDGDGASLIGEIKNKSPLTAVGLLCTEPTPILIARVQRLGAVACLSKDRDTIGLVEALEILFEGGVVFDDAPISGSQFGRLSARRREILVLAAEGLVDKQIAERLGITESTVRNHWQHMFSHLGASNRTEAVSKAIRIGLI